ncbi:hypothetical protein [Plantactinospora sp. CA-290183]|uniref:hypothetical protein n=1 Tax=Plantactinospora sp. CA-290183 TaxID=3240006 RepID=UPI003D94B93E
MTYYLLIYGELRRDRLVAALAALLSLPVEAVDIGDEDETDRNWSAPVICTVSPRLGELHWHLDIYLTEAIAPQPAESDLATGLAQHLRTVVAYPGEESRPSAYWLVGPDGRRTRARIYDDGPDEEPVYRIDAVEHPVAALPGLPLAAIPEVIHEHPMPTPISDGVAALLRPWLPASVSAPGVSDVEKATWLAHNRLGAWEGMVARLAAGWPPDGWYPAEYYRDGMALRDELVRAGQTLPEPVRVPFAVALGEIDQRFVTLTEDDEGAALAAELGDASAVSTDPARWWWQRIPQPVPWRDQPARDGS